MFEKLEITGTYQADSNLQKQLEELPDKGSVRIARVENFAAVNGESYQQIVTEGRFAGESVLKSDAEPPFGVISSYEGDLGLAAAMILCDSLQFGAPTIIYDMGGTPDGSGETRSQLTAEWHHYTPTTRMSQDGTVDAPSCVDTERVSLEELETRAERWFALH